MNAEKKGKDLFVVDNSVPGWTRLRYSERVPEIRHLAGGELVR